MAKNIVIGLSGHGRCGKDTFSELAIPHLHEKGHRSKRVAIADEIKKDLNSFLIEKVGLSPFTRKEEEKALIRPLLVAYGGHLMRGIDEGWWLRKLGSNIEALSSFGIIPIVTDVRYENELDWLHANYNFFPIYIHRKGIKASNSEEAKNNPILKKKCKYQLWWPTYGADNVSEGRPKVVKVVNKILREVYGHVRSVK